MSHQNDLWQAKLIELRRFDHLTAEAARAADIEGIKGALDAREAVMVTVDHLDAQLGNTSPPEHLRMELAGALADAAHHEAILRRSLEKRLGAEAQSLLQAASQRMRPVQMEPRFVDKQA